MPKGDAILDYAQVGWSFILEKRPKAHRGGPALPVSLENLPAEVGTKQAAHILGCSKDTVLTYKEAGLLQWRTVAPPGSIRPVYRFSMQSVMAIRTAYEVDEPLPPTPTETTRRRVRGERKYKHLHG